MSSFHGKRVSRSHKVLLDEFERRRGAFRINDGRRSMGEQAARVAKHGVWSPSNPHGAAVPSRTAPHIREGRENHALDADAPHPVNELAAFYREMGVPVEFNVPGEAWHMDPVDEAALVRAAKLLAGEGGILATLKPGMRHPDVRVARRRLRAHRAMRPGPNRTLVYGPFMRAAAKRFQRARRLTPDGVIGPLTWKALQAAPAKLPAPARPLAVAVRQGVDVSSFQGDIDWTRVAGACDFAFVKATEGLTFVDPTFTRERVEQARAAGLVVGCYHFARPQPGRSGADEAEFAVRIMRSRGALKPGDLRVALDLEDTKVDAARTHAFAVAFCDRVHELTGENAIVYTGPSFWNEHVGGRAAPQHGRALWVAHYTTAASPSVPRGWDGWRMWQYTSQGTVPGIRGRVDVNRFNGTRADLNALRLGPP